MQNEAQHALDFGLMVKGLLSHDNKQDYVNAAKHSPIYRRLFPHIERGVFSSDAMDDLTLFRSEAISFLDASHGSIMDSVSGFRFTPVGVPILVSEGAIVGVIEQGAPLPVCGSVRRHFLEYKKTGAISVFTKTQVQTEASGAEAFITRTLRNLATGCSNKAFIDELLLTDSDTTTVSSQGNTSAAIAATLKDAIAQLDAKPSSRFVLVTKTGTCANIATVTDTAGNLAFPGIHATLGGEIVPGVRLFPIDAAQLPDEDSDGQFCVLFDADAILLDRGEIHVARSEDGNLELSDAPDETNPTVSLFQVDAVGLRVVRSFATSMIRNGAVRISGVEW